MRTRLWVLRVALAIVVIGAGSAGASRRTAGGQAAEANGPIACAPSEPPPGYGSSVRTAGSDFRAAAGGFAYQVVLPGITLLAEPPVRRPAGDAMVSLQTELAAEVDSEETPGDFAFAVTDLETGEHISVHGGRQQTAACVMNLFAIIAALRDVQGGLYPLEDVDALIRRTIYASDAVTGRELYEKVGGGDVVTGVGRVRDLQRVVIGMQATTLDHPPAFPEESLGISAENLITADDAALGLEALYEGRLLNAELTSWLIEAMIGVKPGLNYLTAALPGEATVSHKNGFVPLPDGYVDNDVAIVRFGPEQRYAYAVTYFSARVPEEYADIPLAQRLVRMTWEYFSSKYPD